MFPFVNKQFIQYVVNKAVQTSIKKTVIITHISKNAIENHLDTSLKFEITLKVRVKSCFLDKSYSIELNNLIN